MLKTHMLGQDLGVMSANGARLSSLPSTICSDLKSLAAGWSSLK